MIRFESNLCYTNPVSANCSYVMVIHVLMSSGSGIAHIGDQVTAIVMKGTVRLKYLLMAGHHGVDADAENRL